jgi:hypothetical protein
MRIHFSAAILSVAAVIVIPALVAGIQRATCSRPIGTVGDVRHTMLDWSPLRAGSRARRPG